MVVETPQQWRLATMGCSDQQKKGGGEVFLGGKEAVGGRGRNSGSLFCFCLVFYLRRRRREEVAPVMAGVTRQKGAEGGGGCVWQC